MMLWCHNFTSDKRLLKDVLTNMKRKRNTEPAEPVALLLTEFSESMKSRSEYTVHIEHHSSTENFLYSFQIMNVL